MNSTSIKISFYSDDIPAQDLTSFVNEKISDSSITATVDSHPKKGKSGISDFTNIIFSPEVGLNLLASLIFEILKYAFVRLNKIIASEPVAIIKMKNGTETRIPMSLSNEELRLEVIQCLSKGDVESVNFEC